MTSGDALLQKLRERLTEGQQLLSEDYNRAAATRWTTVTEPYVRACDPNGESFVTGSPYQLWWSAGWFRGNYPKTLEDEHLVLVQKVAALEVIVTANIPPATKHDRKRFLGPRREESPFPIGDVAPVPNLVFVLMPFTLEWSDRVWRRHIKPSITRIPHEPALICLRADDLAGHDVMVDVLENIIKSSVVVADTTGRNPNVFYELGLAHALGKRVILITQDVSDIPFDLQRFRHIVYADNSEGCEKLESHLARFVESYLRGQDERRD